MQKTESDHCPTAADAHHSNPYVWGIVSRSTLPTILYLGLATIVLGTIAHIAATGMIFEDANQDIWQHIAAVRALMTDIGNPSNPFIISPEGSRHFHPLWVIAAVLGRATGASPWEVMFYAPYVSMAVLAIGVYIFARAYFRSVWAPVILLSFLLFAWGYQVGHTGFLNVFTLMYAAPYPATFMIGLGFILWAVTIWSLEDRKLAILLVPLAALMFTIHQLGAVITLITAGCFVILQPDTPSRNRVFVSLAVLAGLGISLFWPYHNPLELVLRPGNSTWEGGPSFYTPLYLVLTFIPAVIGVFGLADPRARPLAAALFIYFAIFLLGLTGLKIATRFLMPTILILQIGMTGLILRFLLNPDVRQARKYGMGILSVTCLIVLFQTSVVIRASTWAEPLSSNVPVYQAALALTGDIADKEPVAAYSISAWPVVATGQKVLSVPWPEPGILDLAERQAAIKEIFETRMPHEALIARAEELGIRSMITDVRLLPDDILTELKAHGTYVETHGTLVRVDLPDR